jgi:hypothetical protein
MQVDNMGLWVLMGVCCAGGLAWALPRELRRDFYAAHTRWRDAPLRFTGTLAGAVLTGIGTGLVFALLGTALGALIARVAG